MAGGSSIDGPPPSTTESRRRSIRSIAGSIRDRFHATTGGRIAFQLLVGLLGLVFVAIGLLLVPLPGPGWLIVLGGVAVWAVEFAWARRLLRFARKQLHRWNVWIRAQHWLVRVPVALALLAAVVAALWMSLKLGLGIDPFERVFGADADGLTGIDPVR